MVSLDGMQLMKDALDAAGISVHLMVQPLGYHTPDADKQGFIDLKEFPFGGCTNSSILHLYHLPYLTHISPLPISSPLLSLFPLSPSPLPPSSSVNDPLFRS